MTDRIEVTLYTRDDCPLCDKAKASMRAAASLHRLPIVIREVDIDRDPALRERFTNDVPVIYVGEREAFRHRVTPDEFAAYVKGNTNKTQSPLANEKCVPCHGGVPAVKGEELDALRRELGGDWRVVNEHHLEKDFAFPDFATALAFTNRIGAIADAEGHHPDLLLGWGKVRVTIWTHAIDGLSRSDFVLAAKIDAA
jgi:4a-hydroxytetrahydrobiopterin dehydratase